MELREALQKAYSTDDSVVHTVLIPLANNKKLKSESCEIDISEIKKLNRLRRKPMTHIDKLNMAMVGVQFVDDTRGEAVDLKNKRLPISLIRNDFKTLMDIAYGPNWQNT